MTLVAIESEVLVCLERRNRQLSIDKTHSFLRTGCHTTIPRTTGFGCVQIAEYRGTASSTPEENLSFFMLDLT